MIELDVKDYRLLLGHIIKQAIDDYIKLQHPKFRQKKYLHETFLDAVDMFFDPEYRFAYLKTTKKKTCLCLSSCKMSATNKELT